jgi:hypothetical protein
MSIENLFRNTYNDLWECHQYMDCDDVKELGLDEMSARIKLIQLCVRIADEYKDELGQGG